MPILDFGQYISSMVSVDIKITLFRIEDGNEKYSFVQRGKGVYCFRLDSAIQRILAMDYEILFSNSISPDCPYYDSPLFCFTCVIFH